MQTRTGLAEDTTFLGFECESSPEQSQVRRARELPFPGAVIADRYTLERELSVGGMGSIWVAYDAVLDIRVAIKLIRDDLSGPGVIERLMLEARLAARVEHPAIVRVLGLDRTRHGAPFIVMELLEGEDLRQLLDREFRLCPVEAVRLLLPIAAALIAAHERGVLHRDLKPENVFVAQVHGRAQPKVVDFGIAAPMGRQRRRLTCAGAVVGSPDYLSPEQALGKDDIDQRADVWGFSAMLYECVTGFPPFAQSTTEELLQDVVRKPVRALADFGIDDGGLWPIIERGLHKDRDARWPDMHTLGVALARWLLERGVEDDVCSRSLRAEWLGQARITPLPPPSLAPRAPVERADSRTAVLPLVRPGKRPRRRWVALGALGIVFAAACTQATTLLSPPLHPAHRVAMRSLLPAPSPSVRRVRAAAERPRPKAVEHFELSPRPARAARRAPKPPRSPGFDPVLGF